MGRDWCYIEDELPEPFLKVRVSDGSGFYSIAFVDYSKKWHIDKEREIKVENFDGKAIIRIKPENIKFWRELH